MTENTTPDTAPQYVNFEARMLASMIDLLLSSLILIPFVQVTTHEKIDQIFLQAQNKEITDDEAVSMLLNYLTSPEYTTPMVESSMIQFVVAGIVVIGFWIARSATPGKMLLGMEIVDDKTLGKPSKKQWIIRYLGYIPAMVPLMLGFVWVLFNKKRQGWHDMMASTVVVYRDKRWWRTLLGLAVMVLSVVVMSVVLV